MPPSPELSSLDYAPDNAAHVAYCMAQAARWGCIRKALLSPLLRSLRTSGSAIPAPS